MFVCVFKGILGGSCPLTPDLFDLHLKEILVMTLILFQHIDKPWAKDFIPVYKQCNL